MLQFYAISIILGAISAILLAALEFRTINEKLRKIIIIIIFICISTGTFLTFKMYRLESNEKLLSNQLENDRFQINLIKLDSISQALYRQYLQLNSQEIRNNSNHQASINEILKITELGKEIVDDLSYQQINQQKLFDQNFDSLSNIGNNMIAMSKNVEMDIYPFVPITFWLGVHFKYKESPLTKTTSWDHHNDVSEWFTFYNEFDTIEYDYFGYPEFSNENDAINNFLRKFSMNIELYSDTSHCFSYPVLRGKDAFVKNGKLYISSSDKDYSVTVYNVPLNNELIFYIRYSITDLLGYDNDCNLRSINDFSNMKLQIDYTLQLPNNKELQLVNDINYRDTIEEVNKTRKEFRKRMISKSRGKDEGINFKTFKKNTTVSAIKSKQIFDNFNFDVEDVYFDNELHIDYGKYSSENITINLIQDSFCQIDSTKASCLGQYFFNTLKY